MNELEKIIKKLEYTIQCGPHFSGGEYGDEYEYSRISQNTLKDILTLLKAQEPMKPVFSRIIDHDIAIYKCGACGKEIGADCVIFCPHCGRKAKWNG